MDFSIDIGGAIGGALGTIGGLIGNQQSMNFAKDQFAYQKELAKNQIQWRVEDAKKAGVHPMAALGLASTSFSPVGVSQSPLDFSWISEMGQNANYPAMKAKNREDQQLAQDLAREGVELQNEGLRLDNDFKRWQLQTAMSGATTQALNSPAGVNVGQKEFMDGQADSPVSGNTFSSGTGPLMSLSRMGDVLVAHVDPNKSDALTEDFLKNAATQFIFNDSAFKGRYGLEVAKHFTPSEQKALRNRDAYLAVIPGVGWRFVWDKKFKPRYSKNGREASGKLNRY